MIALKVKELEVRKVAEYSTAVISEREQEVLERISYGYCSKEIARDLYISPHTVLSHCKNLKSKLGAKNAPDLIRIGFKRGLLF